MNSEITCTSPEPSGGVAIGSVAEIVSRCLPGHGRRPAIRFDHGEGYSVLDHSVYLENARRMIAYFRARGAERRVVATLVKNRPEWDMTALGALYTGNILFPLDTTMNEEELEHLLSLSPPDFLLVSLAQLARVRRILSELELRPRLLIADLYAVFEDRDASVPAALEENEILISMIATPPAEDPLPAPGSSLACARTVLARYSTSGTTGLPKVVEITHGNILAQLEESQTVINLRSNEDVLNIGSYTHIATLLEFLVTRSKGFTVTYVTREVEEDGVLEAEIKKLRRQGVRIKALLAVPRFWVQIMKEVLEELKNKPVLRNLYHYLTGIEENAGLHDIGTVDKAKLVAVRRSLRNKLGGHFTYGVSSSSKIDPGVVDIFARLGITVIDIYGATEASGIIARNKLNESRRGSCGRLLASLEARLVNVRSLPGLERPVGELQIKGPTVSAGYLGRPAGSHLGDQGFYDTGDLASIDEDGYLYLVGRRAELIRWDDGTYVDPMHLSNLLVRSIWIKDALVTRLGQDDGLSVFVFPDRKRIENDPQYRERIAIGLTPEQALRPMLEEAIAHAQSLARMTPRLSTETIYLLAAKLERTPTHKIKLARELARLDLTRCLARAPSAGAREASGRGERLAA